MYGSIWESCVKTSRIDDAAPEKRDVEERIGPKGDQPETGDCHRPQRSQKGGRKGAQETEGWIQPEEGWRQPEEGWHQPEEGWRQPEDWLEVVALVALTPFQRIDGESVPPPIPVS